MLIHEIKGMAGSAIVTDDDPHVWNLVPPVRLRLIETRKVVLVDKVAKNAHSGHNTAYVAENGRWWDVTCFEPVP